MNITVRRQVGITPPNWYKRELKLIDSALSVFWNNRFQKYLIARKVPANVFREGYLTEYIIDKCDRRSLNALKKAVYEREVLYETADKWFRKIDEENAEKGRRAGRERAAMFRDFYKKVWKFKHSETVSVHKEEINHGAVRNSDTYKNLSR